MSDRAKRHNTTAPGDARLVEVRGPSGRLYGRLDPQTLVIEFKWSGKPVERIDLSQYRVRLASGLTDVLE